MKKLASYLFLSALFASSAAKANETTIVDVSQYQLMSYKSSLNSNCLPDPFAILVDADAIAGATVPTGNTTLRYAEGQVEALFGFKFSKHAGATLNVGAGVVNMHWPDNDFFSTQNFGMINVGVSGYTDSICHWFWQTGINGQFSINDNIDNPFTQAARYGAMLWGRYNYSPALGMHLGVLVFTGVRKTNAYPIIGVDYAISRKWQLNAIFPLNMAVVYSMNKYWSLSAAGRPFVSRQRLSSDDAIANGIYEYRNYGTELSLNYNRCSLQWSIYGGYSFGGTVKIEDTNAVAVAYRVFRSAPYVGLNFLWAF